MRKQQATDVLIEGGHDVPRAGIVARCFHAIAASRFVRTSPLRTARWFGRNWGTVLVLPTLLIAGVRISQFKYAHCAKIQFIGHSDEASYIEMGQSLAQGRGLKVDYISFYFIPYPREITHREDHWPPFLAFVHALFFSIYGVTPQTTRLAPIFLGTIVLPLLTAALTIALSGRSYVGLAAGIAMLAQPLVFGEAVVSLSDLPMATLVTGFLWAAVAARRRPWMHIVAGLMAALAFYAKGSQLFLLAMYPILALLICGPRTLPQRWLWIGLAAGFAGILPWLVSNQRLYGSPLHSTQRYVSGYFGLDDWERSTYSIYWGKDAIGPLPKTSDRWTKYWREYWPATARYRLQFTEMMLAGPELDRSVWHQFGDIGKAIGDFLFKPPAALRHPLLWIEGKHIDEPMVNRGDALPPGSAVSEIVSRHLSRSAPRIASRSSVKPAVKPIIVPDLDETAADIPGNHRQIEAADLWKPLSQWREPDIGVYSTISIWFFAVLLIGSGPLALAAYFWRRKRRRLRLQLGPHWQKRWKWLSRLLRLGCLLCVASLLAAFAIELRNGVYIGPLAAALAVGWLASEWLSVVVFHKRSDARWMVFPIAAIFLVLAFEWAFVVYFWEVIQRFAFVFVPPLAAVACVAAARMIELPLKLLWQRPPRWIVRHAPHQIGGIVSLTMIIISATVVLKHRAALADYYTKNSLDPKLSTYRAHRQYSEAGHWIRQHFPNAVVMCRNPWELKFYCAATNKTVEVPYADAKALFTMARYYHVTYYLHSSHNVVNDEQRPALWPYEMGRLPGLKLIHAAGDGSYRFYQIQYDKLR